MRKQELLNLVDNLLESIDNSINYLNSNKTDYNLGIVQGKVDLINSLLDYLIAENIKSRKSYIIKVEKYQKLLEELGTFSNE